MIQVGNRQSHFVKSLAPPFSDQVLLALYGHQPRSPYLGISQDLLIWASAKTSLFGHQTSPPCWPALPYLTYFLF